MSIPTLNIIGAGRLGQTLGRLFSVHQCFNINGICNSSKASAQKAVDFIGAGVACRTLDQLPPANVILIATPDAAIEATALALSRTNLHHCKLVFHCSGATSSAVLASLKSDTTSVASVHPNMTFASASESVDHFAGTYCAFEGDNSVYDLLASAFAQIGGHVFQIDADKKALYHAALCLSCNYLVALLDVAVELYLKTGVSREVALATMQPLVTQTVHNVFALDTVNALTGPVARGDSNTVQKHLGAIENPYIKEIYKNLGLQLVKLSSEKGDADKQNLQDIERVFKGEF